jgi:DNA-directed RNA polymerase subunit K
MAKDEGFEYTKYEKARVLGARALQLSMGAPIAIDIPKKKLEEIRYNVLEIAKLEMEAGKIPITVKRPELKVK